MGPYYRAVQLRIRNNPIYIFPPTGLNPSTPVPRYSQASGTGHRHRHDYDVPQVRPVAANNPRVPPIPPVVNNICQVPPFAGSVPQGLSAYDPVNLIQCIKNLHPSTNVYSEGELCGSELMRCVDLAEQEHEVPQGLGVPYQVEDWRRFWREVFRDWNAFTGNGENRPMPAITLIDTRVQVGHLRYDHPPSLRYPDVPGAARKHPAPVCMSISTATQDQRFTTVWKDGDRKFINPSHAELNGGTIAWCIDTVIQWVDSDTKERTKAYNIRLIINAARRRVMHFSQTGTGRGTYLPPDTERPVLLETVFLLNLLLPRVAHWRKTPWLALVLTGSRDKCRLLDLQKHHLVQAAFRETPACFKVMNLLGLTYKDMRPQCDEDREQGGHELLHNAANDTVFQMQIRITLLEESRKPRTSILRDEKA
ncbi:hypothetical protein ACKAV7_002382 [Fusarium commune]